METKHTNSDKDSFRHESYLRHRRQSAWQIFIPIGVGSLLVLAAFVVVFLPVTGFNTGVDSSQYADASLIWLISPVLFLTVLIALVLVGLIILFAKILKTLPRYTSIGQHYSKLISSSVQYWSRRMVVPLIEIKSRLASIKSIFKSVSGDPGDKA